MSLKDKLKRLLDMKRDQETFEESSDVEQGTEFSYLQWWEADVARLRREYDEMKEIYPDFEIFPLGDGRIAWKGNYMIRNQRCEIAVVYPYYYPLEPPKVYVLEPEIEKDSLESDGSIPVFSTPLKDWETKLTAKEILSWAIEWSYFSLPGEGSESNGRERNR